MEAVNCSLLASALGLGPRTVTWGLEAAGGVGGGGGGLLGTGGDNGKHLLSSTALGHIY